MAFKKSKSEEWYLHNTEIENYFINEYLPTAPGDYVKVYLYALMFAECGMDMDNHDLASDLAMTEGCVREAWEYWEERGAVILHRWHTADALGFDVEFPVLKGRFFGDGMPSPRTHEEVQPPSEEERELDNMDLQALNRALEEFHAAPLSSMEAKAVSEWFCDLNASPAVILYAYNYAREHGTESYRYVGKVLRSWLKEGYDTVEKIEATLDIRSERGQMYKRVLNALGIYGRSPSEDESAKMDRWFDEMGFAMDRVLDACHRTSGIQTPNIKYVNSILERWYQEAGRFGDPSESGVETKIKSRDVFEYYEHLRRQAEARAEAEQKQLYQAIPEYEKLEADVRKYNVSLSKAMFSKDEGREQRIEEIRGTISRLVEQMAAARRKAGFDDGFGTVRYSCAECKDTGTLEGGATCQCFRVRAQEAIEWLKRNKR